MIVRFMIITIQCINTIEIKYLNVNIQLDLTQIYNIIYMYCNEHNDDILNDKITAIKIINNTITKIPKLQYLLLS